MNFLSLCKEIPFEDSSRLISKQSLKYLKFHRNDPTGIQWKFALAIITCQLLARETIPSSESAGDDGVQAANHNGDEFTTRKPTPFIVRDQFPGQSDLQRQRNESDDKQTPKERRYKK